jgi:hypothetical protein
MLRFFPREKITVSLISGASGVYVGGEWVPSLAAPTPIRIIAPQPLSANDTQFIEDGEHVRSYLKSWSDTRLYPREGGEDADRIVFDGDTYKVTQTDNRSILGRFYAFVMRRLEPGTV